MNEPFSSQLQRLRTVARLTNSELARLAGVPESLISGLQNDNRRVGEMQARKIAGALRLTGNVLEDFILHAINTSTEKVLNESKPYHARLLNHVATQLREAGISAESISRFTVKGNQYEQDVILILNSGCTATLRTQLICA